MILSIIYWFGSLSVSDSYSCKTDLEGSISPFALKHWLMVSWCWSNKGEKGRHLLTFKFLTVETVERGCEND